MNTRIVLLITALALAAIAAPAADKKKTKTSTTTTPPPITVTASEPTTAIAIRGRPPTQAQNISRGAKQLKQQVQTLRTNIAQSGWTAELRVHGAEPVGSAVGELTREVNALQASNGGAAFDTGRHLAVDLQTQLAQLASAEQALGGARDAMAATTALTQMSASLDKMIQRIDTLPPCCTEGICCHVGIQ